VRKLTVFTKTLR